MKTLPVEDTWINFFFSTLKNEKRKHFNIAVGKITELPIEFEGCNISWTSQIGPKFTKFCTRKITLVYLPVKPN